METLLSETPNPTAGNEVGSAQEVADTGSASVEQPNAGEVQAEVKTDDVPKAEEAKGAPESYEDFKFEEGKSLPAESLEDVKSFAKEMNLTQEQAQKLAERELAKADSFEAMGKQRVVDESEKWKAESKIDKEFGGDKLAESIAIANQVFTNDDIVSPKMREILNASQLGNHPEVIRTFYRIGKQISQDKFVAGNTQSETRPDIADRLYGKKG